MSEIKNKKAVVLAGGGSRGAYQIGAWKALKEIGYEYEIVTGVSVGSLNGALMVAGDIDKAEKLWEKITTESILKCKITGDLSTQEGQNKLTKKFITQLIKEKSMDQSPLKELMKKSVDYKAFYDSPVDFGLATILYPKLKPLIITKNEFNENDESKLIDYLMASSACFPAMKAYKINDEKFIDGGYYDNLPLNIAVDLGATEIVAIDLGAFGLRKKVKDKNINIKIISPRLNLGFTLLFDGNFAKKLIRLGYFDTQKAFSLAVGFKYTFEKDAFSKMEIEKKYNDFINRMEEKFNISKTETPDFIKKTYEKVLFRNLINASNKKTAKKSPYIPMAEYAGEFFKLDEYKMYSLKEFNEKLKFEIINTEREVKLKKLSLSERLQFNALDKEIVYLIYNELMNILKSKDITPITCLAATLFPTQFLAAIYLCIM